MSIKIHKYKTLNINDNLIETLTFGEFSAEVDVT